MTRKWMGAAAVVAISATNLACGSDDGASPASATGGAGSTTSFGGSGGSIAATGGAAGGVASGGSAGASAPPKGVWRCARFITKVIDHAFGPGQNQGQDKFPAPLFGPPKGGGCCQGSLDVVSLGNGGFVTVEFGESEIVDGPGTDFIVFENAFDVGGDPAEPYAELGTVAVSSDGEHWTEFPCTATAYPYGSCAGWHPVFANPDDNTIDPLDPAVSGGDPFDLADIGVGSARYVRITDRVDQVGPAGVFDLDAVGIVNAECR